MSQSEYVMVRVKRELLEKTKQLYPDLTKKRSATATVNLLLEKLLEVKKKDE